MRRLVAALVLCCFPFAISAQQRPVTFEELMRFRTIQHEVFSDSGQVLAFTAQPDRGEPEGVVRRADRAVPYRLPRASHPALSSDGRWAAFRLNAPLERLERARLAKKDAPEPGLLLVTTATGRVDTLARAVGRYSFSPDGRLLAYGGTKPDTLDADPSLPDSLRPKPNKKQRTGKRLTLRMLATGAESSVPFVHDFAFSEDGRWLAYTVAHPDSTLDGLYAWDLEKMSAPPRALDRRPHGAYGPLAWSKAGTLAFVATTESAEGETGAGALYTWNGEAPRLRVAADTARGAWHVPAKTRLEWTDRGERLFFGMRQQQDDVPKDTAIAPLDVEAILAGRTVDVWHGDDPRIVTHQKARWKSEQERSYRAVLHPDGRVTRVEAPERLMPQLPQNGRVALVRDETRYRREVTWDGSYHDLLLVNLETGAETAVATRLRGSSSLSPDGAAVVYFDEGQWHAYTVRTGARRVLTEALGVSFADEENDVPAPAGAYGMGGWVDGGKAALLYSRYDVWQVPVDGSTPLRLTDGQARRVRFRVEQTDEEQRFFAPGETLLLTGFDEVSRGSGFYRARVGTAQQPPLERPRPDVSALTTVWAP